MSSDILKILLVTWMIKVIACVFFHEPSAILLSTEDKIDFGFSMGYQKGKKSLVISAPIESNTMHSANHTIGKVFTCPISNLVDIKCDQANIDVKALAKYELDGINPNQNFFLGASISTTHDYFLTCAPLWSSNIKYSRRKSIHYSFGTCFTYNGTANRYVGYLEQFLMNTNKINRHSFEGGVGWNTLADEDNDLILITKPFTPHGVGNIFYLNTKQPLAKVSQVIFSDKILNLGFGMAAGKFFSNKTSYAVSYQDYTMAGKILFLEKNDGEGEYLSKVYYCKPESCQDVQIFNKDYGSMFGYTMASVDITGDGFTELIVGAPAQRDESQEYGAVHIYVGGSVESMKNNYKKTIIGVVEGARFGMTIATSDFDGDDIPEIIVSAPYEDSGNGAVYIISGHKVHKTLFALPTRQVQVSKLNPQKITKSDIKLFGYSLQVIDDLDGNGCKELAIGSPGSSTVFLFRSLQAVKVTMDLSTNSQKISYKDYKFDVKVCISMEFNKKSTHVQGKLLVNNHAYGNGVKLDNPKYFVDLSDIHKNKQSQHCQNVPVRLENRDIGVYRFDSEIEMFGLLESLNEGDFSKTVAVFNSHSKTKQSIAIERRCEDDDCKPKLSMISIWSAKSDYILGSSVSETVTVIVSNDGFNANGGCVHVTVDGAQIKKTKTGCKKTGEFYKCNLRNPLRGDTSEIIALELDMITNITNLNKSLEIETALFEDCNNASTLISALPLSVAYQLDTKDIYLTNENHNLNIAEKSLSDEAPQILNVDQVYLIHNSGKLKWLDLDVEITFIEAEFKFSVKEIAGIHHCPELTDKLRKMKCKVDLEPNSITKVILGIQIEKKSIGGHIKNVKETKIESLMSLSLNNKTKNIESRLESIVTYNKDTFVGNNINLLIFIGILVALLLLGGLCFILYKYGFFQGQNKKKLDRARATVRQRSIKKSTASQDTQKLHEDNNSHCDMEIVDDNAFEEPSTATPNNKDSHKLIEENAQVHNENKH